MSNDKFWLFDSDSDSYVRGSWYDTKGGGMGENVLRHSLAVGRQV